MAAFGMPGGTEWMILVVWLGIPAALMYVVYLVIKAAVRDGIAEAREDSQKGTPSA